jgi:hypothetical protein
LRGATLVDDLNILLGDLCVQWGFCNGMDGADLIASQDPLTDDAFAKAVLAAEGFNADLELAWRRKLKRLFSERYGSALSQAEYRP